MTISKKEIRDNLDYPLEIVLKTRQD